MEFTKTPQFTFRSTGFVLNTVEMLEFVMVRAKLHTKISFISKTIIFSEQLILEIQSS